MQCSKSRAGPGFSRADPGFSSEKPGSSREVPVFPVTLRSILLDYSFQSFDSVIESIPIQFGPDSPQNHWTNCCRAANNSNSRFPTLRFRSPNSQKCEGDTGMYQIALLYEIARTLNFGHAIVARMSYSLVQEI
jgi:hypothetical protein